MVPLSGRVVYEQICRLNNWIYDYLPNASAAPELPQAVDQVKRQSVIQKV
jgi:hypothetical protein